MYIDKEIKKIKTDGFKPWGIVIPNPQNAPKGSGVFQFRKGSGRKTETAALVIDPSGKVIRGTIARVNGRIEQI